MTSASALKRNCGYVRILQNIEPRTASEREKAAKKKMAADRGTVFHAAIETWAKTGTHVPLDDPEMEGWMALLMAQWRPGPTFVAEEAWGLTPDGGYCEVIEPEPHKYQRADGGPLLTAGRCDGWWTDDEGVLWCVDWKTGRWPVEAPETNLQLNAAGIALSQAAFCKSYITAVYYCQDGVFEWGPEVKVASPEWRARLGDVMAAALLGDDPRPGEHCRNCWERRRCQHAVEG